jgi:hypothetical protein
MAADNPNLSGDVSAVIDQGAGTIYAVLPFTDLPPTGNNGHRTLVPQWLAQGSVSVGGIVQTSGQDGQVFGPQQTYRVSSADGAFHKDYTVKVLEVNTRIYVKKNATGDNTGVSWTNAFRSLGDACDAAEKLPAALAVEIWIAEGNYRPSETRDKAAYFKVSPNTGYFGGFAGTEADKDGRNPDPTAHRVIITGDLGGGVYSEHLFMNTSMGSGNAGFGEMTFTKARALTGTGMARNGAAICVAGGNNITITNGIFKDLQANWAGGAVNAESTGGTVSITGCSFENTNATYGGGVYVQSISGTVSIMNCDFESIDGIGAAYTASSTGTVNITGCNFNNTTNIAAHASTAGGTVNITNCNFENHNGISSGALYAYGSDSGGTISITNCHFKNTQNISTILSNGGAIVVSHYGGAVSIRDCTFTDTQTDDYGGAVSVSSYTNGAITIADCDFDNTQSVTAYGGAVYASSNGAVSITNCGFTNTRAGTQGGAVYARGGSVTITDCEFTDTEAGFDGGAVYAYGSGGSFILSGSEFTGTRAGRYAGAVSVLYFTSNTMTDCEFTDTQAGNSGGAVWLYNTSPASSIIIRNYISTETSALGDIANTGFGGGSLELGGGTITVENAVITNATSLNPANYVGGGGGGIYIVLGNAALSQVTFNTVKAQGGSPAYGFGGAVYFREGTNLTMTDCVINGAEASGAGGAIGGSGTSCLFNGVSFTNCDAPQGSLLYGNGSLDPGAGPAYIVKPGCTVDGTTLTATNWLSVLTPAMLYLIGGSTIGWSP